MINISTHQGVSSIWASQCLSGHHHILSATQYQARRRHSIHVCLMKSRKISKKGFSSETVHWRRFQQHTSCEWWVQMTTATLWPAPEVGSSTVKRRNDISTWLELKCTRFRESLKDKGLSIGQVHCPCLSFQHRKRIRISGYRWGKYLPWNVQSMCK